VEIETHLQEDVNHLKEDVLRGGSGGGGGGGGGGDPAAMAALRDDLAEVKAEKKGLEKEVLEAQSKNKDLEAKVTKLNEDLMRSHFEKREG